MQPSGKPIARLFVDAALSAGASVALDSDQSHYIGNVLRGHAGQTVRVFNGRDGEWSAAITDKSKKGVTLGIVGQLREQGPPGPDVWYYFAPLKRARLDYMVQKATELGACRIQPVLTAHTHLERFKIERLRANTIEAAEQCELLNLPSVHEVLSLAAALDQLGPRLLIFCDEAAAVSNPVAALLACRDAVMRDGACVLIGPEGGFSDDERQQLLRRPVHLRLSLGPRIMRADTAAVAALALVMATVGDWRSA